MNVKGTAVRARLRFLRESLGQKAHDAILATLSEDDRVALDTVLPTTWIPVELVDRLDLQIVRYGGPELAREYGAFSARQNLARVYKVFLDQAEGDPQALLESLVSLHGSFYDRGSMRVLDADTGSCRIEIDFAGFAARFRCQVSMGFIEAALGMLDVRGLRVEETGCQTRGEAACAFTVRWEPQRAGRPLRPIGDGSAAARPLPADPAR